MAAVLAPSRGGILLNASPSVPTTPLPYAGTDYLYTTTNTATWPKRSPRFASTSLPPLGAYAPAPSAPSSSSSAQSSPYNSPRTASRKIRFAPLPDPRRAVLITDSGEELPLPTEDDSDDEPRTPPDVPSPSKAAGEWAAVCALKTDSPLDEASTPLASAYPKQPTSPYPTTSALPSDGYVDCKPEEAPTPPAGFIGKARRALMRPLLTGAVSNAKQTRGRQPASASASTPTLDARLGASLEDLRTFNLWRVESRDSTSTTGGSRASSRERTPSVRSETFGAPLSRSQSSSSAKRGSQRPPSRSSLLPFRRATADPPKAPPSAANGVRGVRMLNGHVYGKKKHAPIEQKNPFATASAGDDFVEWGYGGAGSVKTAKQLGVSSYKALHGNNNNVAIGNTGADPNVEDEDDGSGITWARKRREARAREAAEKRAREEAHAAAAVPPPSIAEEPETPAATPGAPAPEIVEPAEVALPLSPVVSPPAEASDYVHTSLHLPAPKWADAPAEGAETPSSEESGGSPATPSFENGGEDAEGPRATSIGASVEIVSRHKH